MCCARAGASMPRSFSTAIAVADVVDEGGAVVQPVGERDRPAASVCVSRHLLEAAVQVADLGIGADDLLAVEGDDDAERAVRGGMRGPEVEGDLLEVVVLGLDA